MSLWLNVYCSRQVEKTQTESNWIGFGFPPTVRWQDESQWKRAEWWLQHKSEKLVSSPWHCAHINHVPASIWRMYSSYWHDTYVFNRWVLNKSCNIRSIIKHHFTIPWWEAMKILQISGFPLLPLLYRWRWKEIPVRAKVALFMTSVHWCWTWMTVQRFHLCQAPAHIVHV